MWITVISIMFMLQQTCRNLEHTVAEVYAMWVTVISIMNMSQQTDAGSQCLESLRYTRCGLLSSALYLCYNKRMLKVSVWSRKSTRDVGTVISIIYMLKQSDAGSKCLESQRNTRLWVTVISNIFMLQQTDPGSQSLDSLRYTRCGLLSSATCLCYSKQMLEARAWSR